MLTPTVAYTTNGAVTLVTQPDLETLDSSFFFCLGLGGTKIGHYGLHTLDHGPKTRTEEEDTEVYKVRRLDYIGRTR